MEKRRAQSRPIDTADFKVTENPVYVMNRILRGFHNYMTSALRPTGIKLPMWRVLWALQELGPQTVGELSDCTTIERSTLSRVIDAMEEDGLVRSEASESDRRYTKTYLTEKGEQRYAELLPMSLDLVRWAFEGFEEEEIVQLAEVLDRVRGNVERPAFQVRRASFVTKGDQWN
jgi:DNA-binding MarR family transcriptional regulator